MGWVAVIVWAAAVVFAIVLLGFCAYEVWWKALRLRADLDRLRGLESPARQLGDDLRAAQERLARAIEMR